MRRKPSLSIWIAPRISDCPNGVWRSSAPHKLKTVPIQDVLERYKLKKQPFSD